MQKTFLKAMFVVGLIGTATLVPVASDGQVYVRIGPPRRIYERRPPAPGAGYAWRTGYHRWDGNRYIWTPGEYIAPPRPRAYWVQGRWVAGPRGYYWREGYWR